MNLEQCIESAFADRKYPQSMIPKTFLKHTDIYTDALYFINRNWRTLTCTELNEHSEAIFGFSPHAYCYYLPGIMLASIRENNYDLLIVDTVLNQVERLVYDYVVEENLFLIKRWILLTYEEYAVVQEWLRWLAGADSANFSYKCELAEKVIGWLIRERDSPAFKELRAITEAESHGNSD